MTGVLPVQISGGNIIAVNYHLFAIEYQPTQYAANRELFPDLTVPADGFCPDPAGPGLGLTPNENLVRAATIS